MADLADLINEAVVARMTPDFIEKEINTRVDKLLVESIDKALRTWSDTGKLIEKAVEDALRVNSIDLPSYGDTVTKILRQQIEARVAPLVAGKLAEDMDALLHLAPATIKLSKIAEMLLEESGVEWGDAITVNTDEYEPGKTSWIYLDDEIHERPSYSIGDPKYRCKYRLMIDREGKIASAIIHDVDMKKVTQIGRSWGLGQSIRAWHACGTVIEMDIDHVVIGKGDY